jgi:hypothetical protein
MRIYILLILLLGITYKSHSQSSFFLNSDSLSTKRVRIVSTAITANWITQTSLASRLWYKNFDKSNFHLFDDSKEWLQMDKMGHFYASNKLSKLYTDCYIWSGMPRKKSVIIGSLIGLGYETTLEILDGFNTQWGFSLYDMVANTLGSLTYASQKIMWNEERFILKFSSHSTPYASERPNVLGATPAERFLKDYNGQTYWLSFSPFAFSSNQNLPKWLCLSFGYSIDQKIIGDNDFYFNPITNKSFNAKREFLVSLDVDFSKLPIKNRLVKAVISRFNYLKIPFPTLIFSNGQLIGKGIYF